MIESVLIGCGLFGLFILFFKIKSDMPSKSNAWEYGDRVRNINTFNTVVFTRYSADGKYFYHEESNRPLRTELYRKC